MQPENIVSREEWLNARKELLAGRKNIHPPTGCVVSETPRYAMGEA